MKISILVPTSGLFLSISQAQEMKGNEHFDKESLTLIKKINSDIAIMTLIEIDTDSSKICSKIEAEKFAKDISILRQNRIK